MSDVERWHLSRSINLGHLVTTAIALIGAFWFFSKQDTRLTSAEINIQHLQSARVADEARAERRYDEFQADLRAINGKLDRLIEYQRDN